jgi:hypothetical protein
MDEVKTEYSQDDVPLHPSLTGIVMDWSKEAVPTEEGRSSPIPSPIGLRTGNNFCRLRILSRVNDTKAVHCDLHADGLLLTFSDGKTFFYSQSFLFATRYTHGNLVAADTVRPNERQGREKPCEEGRID